MIASTIEQIDMLEVFIDWFDPAGATNAPTQGANVPPVPTSTDMATFLSSLSVPEVRFMKFIHLYVLDIANDNPNVYNIIKLILLVH